MGWEAGLLSASQLTKNGLTCQANMNTSANACAPPCRSASCVSCGTSPAITAASLPSYDYAAFTGQAAANDAAPKPLQLIAREDRITPAELQQRCVAGPCCTARHWQGCVRGHAACISASAVLRYLYSKLLNAPPPCLRLLASLIAGLLASRTVSCWMSDRLSSLTSATCRVGHCPTPALCWLAGWSIVCTQT